MMQHTGVTPAYMRFVGCAFILFMFFCVLEATILTIEVKRKKKKKISTLASELL
jgi:hypothetical protein